MKEKHLPCHIEAERGLLSILLYYPKVMSDIVPLVSPEDFYRDIHRNIFDIMVKFYERRRSFDVVMVANALEHMGIDTVDDRLTFDYLLSLEGFEPSSAGAETYARRIAHLAGLRRLIKAAGEIAALAYEEDDQAMEKAEELILRTRKQTSTDFVSIGEYMPTYISRLDQLHNQDGKVRGLPTGFDELDRILGGLQPGALYIPAARPGVGKTTLCQNFVYNVATKHGKKAAFFSLEMGLDDLMDRFVSMHTKINTQQLRTGNLEDEEWDGVVRSADDFEHLGIFLNYTPGITVTTLKSMARRLIALHDIDMIVVDYLQMLKATIDGKRVTPREMEVAEIARELKQLAGELKIPIVAPAQINREVEHRTAFKDEEAKLTYKIPVLADLRESGELEQSADVVMFLARSEEKDERVKLDVAKHRNGPVGDLDLFFVGSQTRFYCIGEEN